MGSDVSDEVGLASAQSFPASDPPPWTLGLEEDNYRIEHDSMGEVRVPRDAMYGAQTQRARENFPFGPRLQPEFIQALGLVKACSARANAEVGALPAQTAAAIENAADLIAEGKYLDQFVVSVYQTGSGTSTNMNANEVIAHLAGTGVHPNDHVNHSQSSNDVIPSAIHIAAAYQIHKELLPAMQGLQTALEEKAREFGGFFKIGRTHLQDATPMTLGQEFGGYAHQIRASAERVIASLEGLYELPLGGTAIGTGVNAPPGFASRTIQLISERSGLSFREARNHFEAQAAKDAVLFTSASLRNYAVALCKIANDIRWLAAGPRGGIGEIRLPDLQPGSSIMPGKVNPVIPESVLMVCAQVVGHDSAIAWACAAGNFELNTMMPVIAFDLLDSISLLSACTRNFVVRCIGELSADTRRAASFVEQSLAMATFLTPAIGYEKAADIAKTALREGRSVREVALERSGLTANRIAELLRPGSIDDSPRRAT
jgi:fumarate hydratase class II